MRISEEERRQSVRIISARYGASTRIWLFGSRTDDQQRGGDVDIYVEAESLDVMDKIHCTSALTQLFNLKVDLIVGVGEEPIYRIAKTSGIQLQ